MPHASAKDGTRRYCEEAGAGTPLVFFELFMLVDHGRCAPRDPRSSAAGILGFKR